MAPYRWRALDEVSISAFYASRETEGRAALLRLLGEDRAPAEERARIVENGVFYGLGLT